jgi:hypothetical protein
MIDEIEAIRSLFLMDYTGIKDWTGSDPASRDELC